jgi:hypothetical protein
MTHILRANEKGEKKGTAYKSVLYVRKFTVSPFPLQELLSGQ